MRLIVHRCRVAALAAERVYYASHIEVLEPDHPERRFVAALCLDSHAVDTDRTGHPYHQAEAEAFARALLMPPEAFAAVIAWTDPDLAELFTVPLDQVARRRRDHVTSR
ncbi:MAG TPA: ImmA/IrrE family metallo-endopeptidase [Baekduia sp.]|nr:ImmA/IrrE family metallo-endopeptidase [Baekduia sp.]